LKIAEEQRLWIGNTARVTKKVLFPEGVKISNRDTCLLFSEMHTKAIKKEVW